MTVKKDEVLIASENHDDTILFSKDSMVLWLKKHGADLIMVIVLFWFSFYVKILFYYWFKNHIGDLFTFTLRTEDAMLVRRVLFADPEEPLYWQGFGDMPYYYVPYVRAFSEGWNPYTGSSSTNSPLNGYVYGPLYVFFISIGTMWFGLSPEKSIFYSNLVFDAGNVVLVYLIMRRTTGYALAVWASIITMISPVVLFYSDFKLLNMPQVTFFALLALYFLISDHDDLSILSIAIGFLTKQVPLLMLGPALIYLFRKTGVKRTISYLLLFILYVLVFSYPWIAKTPKLVLLRMFAPGTGKSSLGIPAVNVSMTLPESLLYKGHEGIAKAIFPYFTNHVFFILAMGISALLVFFGYELLRNDPSLHVKYYAFFFLIGHVMLARGLYKYYDAFLIPFMVLAVFMQPPNPYGMNLYVMTRVCPKCTTMNKIDVVQCKKCKTNIANEPKVFKYELTKEEEQALTQKQPTSLFVKAMIKRYRDAISKWMTDVLYALVGAGIIYYINIQILNPPREEHPLTLFYVTIFFAVWLGPELWAAIYVNAPNVYNLYKAQFIDFLNTMKTKFSKKKDNTETKTKAKDYEEKSMKE